MRRAQSMPIVSEANVKYDLKNRSFSCNNLSNLNNLTRPPSSPNIERKIIVTNEESDQISVDNASVSVQIFFRYNRFLLK